MTDEAISKAVTKQDPPGTIFGKWIVAEPRKREDEYNNINRLPCNDCDHRSHVLMCC
jgi:hypothetical protein